MEKIKIMFLHREWHLANTVEENDAECGLIYQLNFPSLTTQIGNEHLLQTFPKRIRITKF